AHAFIYSSGAMLDLGTLGGTFSAGWAISSSEHVVGDSLLAGNTIRHAFLYANGTMLDLGTLGGDTSQAFGVNSGDDVVGYSYRLNDQSHPLAFLYQDGTMMNLNDLIDPSLGLILERATGINDAGQIAVTACNPSR